MREGDHLMQHWHTLTPREAASALETDLERGLDPAAAARRLERYGPNRIERSRGQPLGHQVLEQLTDPMILVLLGACVLSWIASGGEDALESVIILAIVIFNAALSIAQERQAERALAALERMAAPHATAVRGGEARRVPAEEIVPGDLLLLEAGDLVPADALLVETAGVKADESALTGESLPADKRAGAALPEDTPLGDRVNLLIGSTVVTAGRARAVAVSTGMETEVGRIASLLQEQRAQTTPLQRKMAEISRTLSFLCLSACAVMFGVGLLQGRDLLGMFLMAVSLAVAAIPEGLSAIVTIVLALGVQRLAARGAIVKKLPAVETLGCASVICSDKTGTLTRNRMTVTEVWTASGRGEQLALTIGALCCDSVRQADGTLLGDPTENAIVEAAGARGISREALEERCPRRAELPFDAVRKRMSAVYPMKRGGGWRVMVKGAPDLLLARCSAFLDGGVRPLDAAARARIERENRRMADGALRVLGIAYREMERLPEVLAPETLERELTFVGLVGMMDPPRPEAREAVAACHRAGIRPVMITGDHKATAVAVARELDILRPGALALTGAELDFMPQALLEETVERCAVYARVTPEHKLRIVQALQKRGAVAAMTGDGVNDAPALRAADIGCAMGQGGTDVARAAADMVLTDDNFSTIVEAVREGRGIYDNIRKAIHYLLSCNIGEMAAVFLATVLRLPPPLLPVQLLWLNLVTDSLPALALGVEPVEPGAMERPPREGRAPLFDGGFSLRLAWQGMLVGGLTLAAYFLGGFVLPGAGTAAERANTMAFATLTLSQLFHAYDVRSERGGLLSIGVLSNPAMNRAFLLGLGMQGAVLLLPPLQRVFSVVPMSGAAWLAVLALSAAPVPVCELVKWRARRSGLRGEALPAVPAGTGAKGTGQREAARPR